MVDLETGTAQIIAETGAGAPLATWSHDGQWILILAGTDVTAISAADPITRITMKGIIREGLYPARSWVTHPPNGVESAERRIDQFLFSDVQKRCIQVRANAHIGREQIDLCRIAGVG